MQANDPLEFEKRPYLRGFTPRRVPRLTSIEPTRTEMAYYRELIETLAAKRRAQGLSQEALSQIMGVSEGMVAKWETGHKMPSCFGLMCWCQALEVRVSLAA